MRSFVHVVALVASGALAVTFATPGHAQEQPSADLRGTYAPLHHDAGLAFEPTDSPATGEVTGNVRFQYAFRPVVLRDARDEIAYRVVEHQFTADVGLSVGLFGHMTLGVDMPVLLGQTGDDLSSSPEAQRLVGEDAVPIAGLGDPGLRLKGTLVKPSYESGVLRGFGFAVDERFTLPLGDEQSFIAEGAVTSETRLLFDYGFGPVSGHLAGGVKVRADEGAYACDPDLPLESCGSRFGHEVPFVLAFALHPHALGIDPEARGTLFVETRGRVPIHPVTPDESRLPLSWHAGVGGRYRIGDLALLAGVELGLLGGVGTAPVRAMFGLSFAPRGADSDGDGLVDDDDKCPGLAEDLDAFEQDDGCPEMDNDGDGLPDDAIERPTNAR